MPVASQAAGYGALYLLHPWVPETQRARTRDRQRRARVQWPVPGMSGEITVVLLCPLGDTQTVSHPAQCPHTWTGSPPRGPGIQAPHEAFPLEGRAGSTDSSPQRPFGWPPASQCLTGLLPPVRQQKLISRTSHEGQVTDRQGSLRLELAILACMEPPSRRKSC